MQWFGSWVGHVLCRIGLPWLQANRKAAWPSPTSFYHYKSAWSPHEAGISGSWELVRAAESQVPLQCPQLNSDKIFLLMKTLKWFSFSLNLESSSVVNRINLAVPWVTELWYLHCICTLSRGANSTFPMTALDLWLSTAEIWRRPHSPTCDTQAWLLDSPVALLNFP